MIIYRKKTGRNYTEMLSLVIFGRQEHRRLISSLCFYIFSKISSMAIHCFYNLIKFFLNFNCAKQKQPPNTYYINTLKSPKMCSYKNRSQQGKGISFKTCCPQRNTQTLILQYNTKFHGNRHFLKVQYRDFISCAEKGLSLIHI